MKYEDVVSSFTHLGEFEQVLAVDRFWNNFAMYYPDRFDHWATPHELLAARAGDCEDFAIAKFLTCRSLGIPTERLRLVYMEVEKTLQMNGQDERVLEGHVVFRYCPKPIYYDIPSMKNKQGAEIYSFDDKSIYLDGSPANKATTIRKWANVLQHFA